MPDVSVPLPHDVPAPPRPPLLTRAISAPMRPGRVWRSKLTSSDPESLRVFLSVVVHHLLRDIPLVAQRRCASGTSVCATGATTSSGPVGVVRAGTAPLIARDALSDDSLLDLRIGFCRLSGLTGGKPKSQS